MENNPYQYNPQQTWPTRPPQPYYPGLYTNQQPGARQALQAQQASQKTSKKAPERMPKVRAQALAGLLKKSLLVVSLATFASFSGLVAYRQVSTASTQKPTTSSSTSSQNQNNNFFNQQGDDDDPGTSTPTATPTTTSTPTPVTSGPFGGSNNQPGSGSGPASGSHSS